MAIREDQDAAESLGIDTTLYKTIALTVSGVLTGLAGAFYFNYMGYIDPKVVFDLPSISIVAIMVVMVGGVATYAGPFVGAVIMVLLAGVGCAPSRSSGAAHQTLFGILLIVIIIFLPNGIVGDFGKIRRLFSSGGRPHERLLEVRGVSRFFGGLAALTDVSFAVEKGEILGLIGPNGAGKTTMFNVVNGFYPPSRGEVLFKGKRISGLKPHQICQIGLARTFQVVKPLQRMSTLDNVIASAFLRAKSKGEALRRAVEILKFTGLWEDRDVVSKGLPLGKRKRLEIARALATEPELLLLDESFAGLNPSNSTSRSGSSARSRSAGSPS